MTVGVYDIIRAVRTTRITDFIDVSTDTAADWLSENMDRKDAAA